MRNYKANDNLGSDTRARMRALEFHVSFGCNLKCESCSHFSNHSHVGHVTVGELRDQIALWRNLVAPRKFCMLGGEPTLNAQLLELISVARDGWPRPHSEADVNGTHLELVTNGLLLRRFPRLPEVLQETRCKLIISIHHDSEEYKEKLKPTEKLVSEWLSSYQIEVVWRPSFEKWSRRYHGYGSTMQPFNNAKQRESWKNCPAKYCVQLYDGKLWKCPPVAYLPMQHEKYHLSDKWLPYLDYRPLGANSSAAEISAFLQREDEPSCLMCPANPPHFHKPNPLNRSFL